MVDTACQVFSASRATAVRDDVPRSPGRAGITEPILYRHFGSKRRPLPRLPRDQAWESFREFAEEAERVNLAGCLGAIADMYMGAARARIRLVDLWIQAISEASEDATIAKAVRAQIREVHDFFAGVIRHGQEAGVIHPDRDPVAEAWIFIGGGLLATIDHRLGGLLGGDLDLVRAAPGAPG